MIAVLLFGFASAVGPQDLRVADVFSDHMVLQQNRQVPIWGTAPLGTKISVIRGWRVAWDHPEMPLYFVQLPQYPLAGWVRMRDEQRRALSEPNVGMAVTIDLALDGIHPANKIDVAERLTRWPLARDYGKAIPVSGPLYSGLQIKGDRVTVRFDHVGEGLAVGKKEDLKPTQFLSGSTVNGFEVVGRLGTWRPAEA